MSLDRSTLRAGERVTAVGTEQCNDGHARRIQCRVASQHRLDVLVDETALRGLLQGHHVGRTATQDRCQLCGRCLFHPSMPQHGLPDRREVGERCSDVEEFATFGRFGTSDQIAWVGRFDVTCGRFARPAPDRPIGPAGQEPNGTWPYRLAATAPIDPTRRTPSVRRATGQRRPRPLPWHAGGFVNAPATGSPRCAERTARSTPPPNRDALAQRALGRWEAGTGRSCDLARWFSDGARESIWPETRRSNARFAPLHRDPLGNRRIQTKS